MEKLAAVDAVAPAAGQRLLQPARLQAALRANDRLKLALSLLQAAWTHARQPQQAVPDLARELAAAGLGGTPDAGWLLELPGNGEMTGDDLHLPDWPRLAARLHDDLATMARPLQDGREGDLGGRVATWLDRLAPIANGTGQTLPAALLDALGHARREHGDSLHLVVMDLHKALNRLAAQLATTEVAGAHAWGLAEDGSDTPRLEAFQRGLDRTRALKGQHPGLDTAATRDGSRLLIQNDIGTNDAHVLVIQVETGAEGPSVTLTYSDLHRQRFAFFQDLLREVGAEWGEARSAQDAALNRGESYWLGSARFAPEDEAGLLRTLEGIGERIVFLIDWNRARKRLLPFVDKAVAVQVLAQAAARRAGHRAWLEHGGEQLVWAAMGAQGAGAFRLGERLDEVLGADAARDCLCDLLTLCSQAMRAGQPTALVADEARAMLARQLRGRRGEFDLLQEHVGLCHALAQALADALRADTERDPDAARALAARAKTWERQADHLLMNARTLVQRQPRWQPLLALLQHADDVADALEEAAFVLGLVAEHLGQGRKPRGGWSPAVRTALQDLADTVLAAAQDQVRALAVAATLDETSRRADHDDFLSASWRVLRAERRCDELLRGCRRALAAEWRDRGDAVAYTLGNELAAALEASSDALLALGHGLRERAFQRIDTP
jgi:uncharacterized protein Yka (UPF0111/DUF47 family)